MIHKFIHEIYTTLHYHYGTRVIFVQQIVSIELFFSALGQSNPQRDCDAADYVDGKEFYSARVKQFIKILGNNRLRIEKKRRREGSQNKGDTLVAGEKRDFINALGNN